MKHVENEFKGVEGTKIYWQGWIPDTKPKAVIQIVHGFGEHSGRYMNVVNKLVPKGFAIYADDHRGHGKSGGKRTYAKSLTQFIEDEKKFYDIIKAEHPELPYFMLGHSMGSGIAQYFALKHQDLLNGLIISGAGTHYGGDLPKIKVALAKGMSKLLPKVSAKSGLDANLISHDKAVVEAYLNDPLVFADKSTTKLAAIMLEAFENLPNVVGKIQIPVLIQVGGEDQMVTGVEKELKPAYKTEDFTFISYEGLYHEVYNELESDREKVLEDLSNWLEKHL